MRRQSQAGFTFIEAAIVLGIAVVLLLVVGSVYAASSGLNARSRLELRANEDLRRNLEALANVLRGADFATLEADLGEDGASTQPTLYRALTADRFGQVFDAAEQLVWKPYPQALPGVPHPGWIAHVQNGVETLIAERVPQGGFQVRLDDGLLHIQLETYYILQNQAVVVEGSTAVIPRN